MGRLNLRCTSCGFHFTVTDAQASKPEGARCPSCLATVGVTGPVEGAPGKKPVRVLAAGPDAGALKLKIGIGVGAGVLVLGGVAAVLLLGSSPPPPEETAAPKRQTSAPPAEPKKQTAQPAKTTAAAKPEAPKAGASPAPVPAEPAPQSGVPVPPVAASPLQAAVPTLPDDLVKSIREELLALKVWHVNLAVSAPEKARIDALLAANKGTPEDVEFLRGVMNSPRLRAVKEEAVLIRETRARLEKEAFEGLPVDKVSMNDGRVLHGRIVEETETLVRLERKVASGLTSVLPLQKADIKEVQKGKGLGGEFKTRWEAAVKGGPATLGVLLAWCKENSLPLQASLTAFAILIDDPGRGEARQEAALAADPVARMLEAEKQGGFITFEGRRWVPRELKEKLLRDGNALVDGHWMKGKPHSVSVPSLLKYENQSEKPVQISGNMGQDEVITWSVTQGQEKFDSKVVRRFYAAALMNVTASKKSAKATAEADQIVFEDKADPAPGAAMRGEVTITVPVNGPILEASVMTAAEVKSGGEITVFLVVDGKRELLYKCASKEDKTHKLPESIRGKTEVQLVAEISGRASYASKSETKRAKNVKKDTDRVLERGVDMTFKQLIPEYPAMLFPSHANTFDVFRLTATTAEPAPGLDKLFENAPGILH